MKLMEWEEYSKIPKLKSYTAVPTGFEVAVGQFRSYPYEIGAHLELGKEEAGVALWSSTDMPLEDEWDDEIRTLNKIQNELGELNEHQRALRCLVASYELLHYQHRKALNYMFETIGSGKYMHEMPVGWFVTWWPPNMSNRVQRLAAYIEFIKAWEQKQKSLTIRTSKQFKQEVLRNIYARLGELTPRKRNYVLLIIEKLESFSNTFHYPELFYTQMELSRYLMLLRNKMDQLITPIEFETKVPRTEDELIRRIEEYKQPLWYHGFFNEIDSWLEWTGKGKKVDFSADEKQADIEVLKNRSEYFYALNNFMAEAAGESLEPASGTEDSKIYMQEIKGHINEPSKVQFWLLGCLWKSLKEQLRLHSKRTGVEINLDVEDQWLNKF